MVVRADSEDAVRRLVEDDPFRVNGLISEYSVTEWEPIIGQWASALASARPQRVTLARTAGDHHARGCHHRCAATQRLAQLLAR